MIWLISTAIVLVLLGAYARAVAATPPDEYEPVEHDPRDETAEFCRDYKNAEAIVNAITGTRR